MNLRDSTKTLHLLDLQNLLHERRHAIIFAAHDTH